MTNSAGAKTIRFLTALAFVALFLTPASAGTRIALVIGNSSYLHVPKLGNPANDAKLMARTLKSVGFELVGGGPQLNLDKEHFDSVVQKFGRRTQGADVALFYYAGHGLQANGANYLVPIDANPVRQADMQFQMLNASLVLQELEESGTKLNIIILDACRNNPFAGSKLRGMVGGLAQMRAPEGTVISYATQPGNVAQDGSSGHSPYTRALATMIRRPGLHLFETFNQVGLAVKRATGGEQEPWLATSPIEGSFLFDRASASAKTGDVVASLETAPKKTPSIKEPPAPGGNFTSRDLQKVRAVAREYGFRLPPLTFKSRDRNVSDALQKFVGIWVSKEGWNGRGRKAMLIVTDVDSHAHASVFFVWGPPTAAMPARLKRISAGFHHFGSKIEGTQFKIHARRFVLTAALASDGTLSLTEKRTDDGRTLAARAVPIWRSIASR